MTVGPLVVPVHYDFCSTICFVAHRVLERMQPDLDEMQVRVEWRPVDLVKITGWKRGLVIEGPRRENALRVADELGVAVRMPGAMMDSRRAHAVALALAGSVREPAWRERVWSAIFEEGRDVGAHDEVERLAPDLSIGLTAIGGADHFSALDRETAAAREADVIGVPTFHVGFPLGGIQEPDTMRLLLQRWVEKRRRDGAE
jgi:predicted DsbA family dithiol-disulfide isomerase